MPELLGDGADGQALALVEALHNRLVLQDRRKLPPLAGKFMYAESMSATTTPPPKPTERLPPWRRAPFASFGDFGQLLYRHVDSLSDRRGRWLVVRWARGGGCPPANALGTANTPQNGPFVAALFGLVGAGLLVYEWLDISDRVADVTAKASRTLPTTVWASTS